MTATVQPVLGENTTTAAARLARLVTDPNLRHTTARWRAHEAVYPGSGAAALADSYAHRDPVLLCECRALLAELRERAPHLTDEIEYVSWLVAELEASQ